MSKVIISKENRDTCWIFISASSEDRHLYDIIYAIQALRTKGFNEDDFFIFIDHINYSLELSPYGITKNIFFIEELEKISNEKFNSYSNAIVTVTGHGSLVGISSSREVAVEAEANHVVASPDGSKRFYKLHTLQPQQLVNNICQSKNLKNLAIILCQCYAGVFDHLSVPAGIELCTIGSTKLSESLSLDLNFNHPIAISSDGTKVLQGWLMSIFMIEFFHWIAQPSDIDGDGATCVVDAYKKAATHANSQLKGLKANYHRRLNKEREDHDLSEKRKLKAEEKYKKLSSYPKTKPYDLKIAKDELDKVNLDHHNNDEKLKSSLTVIHTVVEPWLRNESLGKRIIFK